MIFYQAELIGLCFWSHGSFGLWKLCIYLLFIEQDPSPVEHSMVSMECKVSIEWRVEYPWKWWEATKLGSYGAWNTLRLLKYGWRERRSQHLKSEMWCISKRCCLGKELREHGMQGQGQKQKGHYREYPHVFTNREGWLGPGDGVEVGDKLNWDIFWR